MAAVTRVVTLGNLAGLRRYFRSLQKQRSVALSDAEVPAFQDKPASGIGPIGVQLWIAGDLCGKILERNLASRPRSLRAIDHAHVPPKPGESNNL
jgi:hypothetical protein